MKNSCTAFEICHTDGEKEIDIQLWDTAGQERFRSKTASYYKSSQGLLLIYDITKRDTFETIGNWIIII